MIEGIYQNSRFVEVLLKNGAIIYSVFSFRRSFDAENIDRGG